MRLYRSVALLIAASTLVPGHSALAQTEPAPPEATQPPTEPGARCVYYHLEAQRQRRDKKLIEAKSAMLQCAMSECPPMVQQDCLQWIQSIDEQTPSVVFSIEANGQPVTSAKITIDDKDLEGSTATAVPLNPGPHTYLVSDPRFAPQSGTLNVLEGQRYRVFNVRLEAQKPTPEPVRPLVRTETVRPVPLGTWVLLGVGVVGAGAFTTMGLMGKSQENHLRDVCSPNCTDQETRRMKSLYLGADIAAGVGAAALISAGVVFLTRPSYERQLALSIAPLPGGFQTAVTWSQF